MNNKLKGILSLLKSFIEDEENKDKAAEQIRRQEFQQSDGQNILRTQSWVTFATLSLIIVTATIITSIMWLSDYYLIAICVCVGILGSATTALLSALDRKSNGWESKEGDKYPEHGKNDRFSTRMFTFFLFRPFLGIAAGLIVYFAFQQTDDNCFDICPNTKGEASKTILYALIAGLFIKTLLDKIKDFIDKILSTIVK